MRRPFATRTAVFCTSILIFVFAPRPVLAAIPFDVNEDGFVDLIDYRRLALCLAASGPGVATGLFCQAVHFDVDSDVDLAEVSGFQNVFTGPGPPAVCGDGTVNGTEECDTSGESATCNANCTTSRCGDGVRNATAGEQCDDGNTVSGDGCSSICRNENANACAAAIVVGDGTREFSNVGATTDGPAEAACTFFGNSQIVSDIWFRYTASCTGTALFSLCGSRFDTRLAVYSGLGCPAVARLGCSDDNCGSAVGSLQSRLELPATLGQIYTVRVGGYLDVEDPNHEGEGKLTIGCNLDACANGTGGCFDPPLSQGPGCGDATCCADMCDLDKFCCDVTWDAVCAGEAQGVCNGHFPACAAGNGSCGAADATPGCDNVSCCDTVCLTDPFCCLSEWDGTCVNEAEAQCRLTCGPGAGECRSNPRLTPGCNDPTCCGIVCDLDPVCCDTKWDQICVDLAILYCP